MTLQIDDFTPITSANYQTVRTPKTAVAASAPVQLRRIKDPKAEINGYADALAAVDAAELAVKTAHKNHAKKAEALSDLQDAWRDLVRKDRSGERIEDGLVYKTRTAIPAAAADVDLAAENIDHAKRVLASAKNGVHAVLRKALPSHLAQLQAEAAEANSRLAVVKAEAWEKSQTADRLFMALAIGQQDLNLEACKSFLGING